MGIHADFIGASQLERDAAAWRTVTLAGEPLVPEPIRSAGTPLEVVTAVLVRLETLRMKLMASSA